MLLKDLKFDRFPVYIQWANAYTGLAGHSILVEHNMYYYDCQTMYDGPQYIGSTEREEYNIFSVNPNNIEILHWEYLDNNSAKTTYTWDQAITWTVEGWNWTSVGGHGHKHAGKHKCTCPRENFTVNAIGCVCGGI